MDRFNASQSNTQEHQSHTSVLLELVRVANKEAAATMGRFNGFFKVKCKPHRLAVWAQ